jgi:hypothetical protein
MIRFSDGFGGYCERCVGVEDVELRHLAQFGHVLDHVARRIGYVRFQFDLINQARWRRLAEVGASREQPPKKPATRRRIRGEKYFPKPA